MKIATIPATGEAYVMDWECDEGTVAIDVLLQGYCNASAVGNLWLPTY